MKRTLLAVLLMAGVAQAGIIGGPPTAPTCPPTQCEDIFTIYISPTATVAEFGVTVDGAVVSQVLATEIAPTVGTLTYVEPAVEYGFRIYEEGATVAGSYFWDSNEPLVFGCTEIITFGEAQVVIPEPATIGLIVLCGAAMLWARRLAM